jgi:deoxyribodipyrimidine photo-lyase
MPVGMIILLSVITKIIDALLTTMVEETRVQPLNANHHAKGDYVLYWMQASQRAEDNHALEFAIGQANERRLPLIVFFVQRKPGYTLRNIVS